jgi:hypothetical protein
MEFSHTGALLPKVGVGNGTTRTLEVVMPVQVPTVAISVYTPVALSGALGKFVPVAVVLKLFGPYHWYELPPEAERESGLPIHTGALLTITGEGDGIT